MEIAVKIMGLCCSANSSHLRTKHFICECDEYEHVLFQILTGTSTDAQYLRNNYRWYFLPNVNPDGYEYSWTSVSL